MYPRLSRILTLTLAVFYLAACEQFVYTHRAEVSFSDVPDVKAGDAVRADTAVIGRVNRVVRTAAGSKVLIDVRPNSLPDRAVLLATTDAAANTCLEVYAVPDTAHAGRGPYWGALNRGELVLQLGRDRAERIWSGAWDHVVRGLGATPVKPKQ